MVFHFIFRSVMHFEVIFLKEVKSMSSFFFFFFFFFFFNIVDAQLFPHH